MENDLDNEFFKDEKEANLLPADEVKQLTKEELIDIIEGKKIVTFKVTKEMRASIKHALKRGE